MHPLRNDTKITSSEVVGPKFNKTNRGLAIKASQVDQAFITTHIVLCSAPSTRKQTSLRGIRKTGSSTRAERDAFQPYAENKSRRRRVVKGVATAINLQQRNIRRRAEIYQMELERESEEWITAPALRSSPSAGAGGARGLISVSIVCAPECLAL